MKRMKESGIDVWFVPDAQEICHHVSSLPGKEKQQVLFSNEQAGVRIRLERNQQQRVNQ